MVRIFLDPLRGKICGKYLTRYLKIDLEEAQKLCNMHRRMMNMALWNVLKYICLDGLDM
jgi:hypothetical protein